MSQQDLDQKAERESPSPIASSNSEGSSRDFRRQAFELLRRKHVGVPLLGLFVLAAAALIILSQTPDRLPHASTEPDPMASERAAAPDFVVKAFDGSDFVMSENRGKVLLVSFWATECATCLLEIPAFSELHRRYKKEGLEIVAINLDAAEAGKRATEEMWQRGKFEFNAYIDPDKAVAKAFNIETVPSGFVIDRQGRMAFNSYGANDWLAPETARLIEDLLLEE